MQEELLDTAYKVETPEGIDLSIQLAGPIPRALAYCIDLSFRLLILGIAAILLLWLGLSGWGIFLILAFLMEWFYPVLFEVMRKGQTPGKKRMHLAVVNNDLTPISWSSSLIRNLLRAADFMPFGYLFGLTSMCINQHFQRLGDIAAGSIVVHQVQQQAKLSLPKTKTFPPPFSLSLDDQVAFISFAQRHEQMSDDRKKELANILKDATHKKDESAVAYLQGIGCWLLGGNKI